MCFRSKVTHYNQYIAQQGVFDGFGTQNDDFDRISPKISKFEANFISQTTKFISRVRNLFPETEFYFPSHRSAFGAIVSPESIEFDRNSSKIVQFLEINSFPKLRFISRATEVHCGGIVCPESIKFDRNSSKMVQFPEINLFRPRNVFPIMKVFRGS